jgi:hypothetical protein
MQSSLATMCTSTAAFAQARVRLLQLRGAVASIDGGTLLLDHSTVSSAENTTVRTFCSD